VLIDNMLHNQFNLTNSTKDVGNDKASKPAVSPISKSEGRSSLNTQPILKTDGFRSIGASSNAARPAGLEACDTAGLETCATVGGGRQIE
jgi:hypothetical protein